MKMKKNYSKISKTASLFLAFILFSHVIIAQTGTVKGTVTDEKGVALPGANIQVEGTSIGTIVNMTGTYTLENIPVGEQTIKVSFISYEAISKSVTIIEGKTAELSFKMKEGAYSLQDVTVTASKRSQRIQDVPQSISAISGKQLEAEGITDASDYLEFIPGLVLTQIDPTKANITLRGVAPLGGNASTIGYYIGETPISAGWQTPAASSYDVERIEVLRGPQGTLYGEGSMGGTIKVIPNKPNVNNMEFKFNPQFSSTNGGGFNQQYNGMANIPLIKNKLAIRATGYYQNDDGYIKNVGLDIDNINTFEKYGGRAAISYLASDKFYITASAIYNNAKTGGRSVANENFEQNSTIKEPMNDEYSIYSLTGVYNFSFATLTVTGSYFDQEWRGDEDMAALLPTINGLMGMFGIAPRDAVFIDRNQKTQSMTGEARLVSTNPGRLKWTAGVFFKKLKSDFRFDAYSNPEFSQEEIDLVAETILGVPAGTIIGSMSQHQIEEPQQIAFFGEVSYDITPKLNILGGLRVFNETNSYTATSQGLFSVLTTGKMPETLTGDNNETVVNPKITLTYKPIDNVLIYANAAKGFRRGGLNIDISMYPDVTDPSYKSETLWNYELGIKTSSSDGKLTANASLFYNDWKDMQVVTRDIAGFPLTQNVGKAHTAGVDLEVNWAPIKGLLFSANGNYTIAETDVDILIPAGLDSLNVEVFETIPSGTALPLIPKLGMDLAAQYRITISNNITLTPRVEYSYKGESKSSIPDLLNGEKLPSQNIINLRANLVYKGFGLYMFVNNLTNQIVRNEYYYDDATIGKVYFMGRPRTIGLGLNIKL